MDKEMKIIPPDGYEVDKENSTFECIKFKPVKKALPETWEEFCEVYSIQKEETYINNICMLNPVKNKRNRSPLTDRNVLPSEEMAEAVLALCQLIQLRDCYNQGWKPDWNNGYVYKACIEFNRNTIICSRHQTLSRILSFESEELRDKFLENFKDLIEIARPLL